MAIIPQFSSVLVYDVIVQRNKESTVFVSQGKDSREDDSKHGQY